MASLVADNWEAPVSYDENYIYIETSKFDQDDLMSLLENPQNEDYDDERLTNVIRSLEAEITPNNSTNCYSFNNLKGENDPFECQSTSDESMIYDKDDFSKFQDLDFQWMDLEMVPSSLSGGMESLYMEPYGEEMEFGGMKMKSYTQMHSYGNPLMEEHDYGVLWQETNIS